MAKIELKRFTKYGVLWQIKSEFLVKFLGVFMAELKAKNCWVPPAEPGSEGYYTGFAEMLKSPEKRPEAMVEALLAMEEQVTPANWPRLGAMICQARQYGILGIDNTSTQESQALQFWLWCPYGLGGNFAEVEQKIESGKKVYEEKNRLDREYQAREDAARAEKEKRLLTP